MNTVNLFKSLDDHFTLPDLQVKESTKVHDWRWADGPWIEFDMFLRSTEDSYLYTKQFYLPDFQEHCELTYVIEGSFCEWFENLSWQDKLEEMESFADARGMVAEIKADYAAWLNGERKAI
jgi:hypothetical protein